MEKRILPSLMNWIGLETQKGWPLFWCLLGSRRSWMKRPSGQDKTGFIFRVHLQHTLCISDFWTLYALLKCTLKFPVLKVGVGANTFPQLYYCFPSPAQNYIQAYNKREKKKKKGKHPKPTQQTLVCSKIQILAAATNKSRSARPQTGLLSAKEVFHISQKSTTVGSYRPVSGKNQVCSKGDGIMEKKDNTTVPRLYDCPNYCLEFYVE